MSGVASETARRLDSSAAANPPANPEKGISHLRPLPQSWRKKARESAAAAPPKAAHAVQDASTAGLEVLTPGSRDGQKAAVQPAADASSPTGKEMRSHELSKLAAERFAPAAGAAAVSAGHVHHTAAVTRLDAHVPAGGVERITLRTPPLSPEPAPIISSPKSPHMIKPYTPRGTTLATIVEPNSRSTAAFNFVDDVPVVPIPLVSAGQDRTFASSLHLIIEALSFNQMTLGGGFDAFDIDGDGRISRQDFQRSVDDLQLELDEHTIQLMHRCLDADADGFIGRQVSRCDAPLHVPRQPCRSAYYTRCEKRCVPCRPV
jgi:hypothetical protein